MNDRTHSKENRGEPASNAAFTSTNSPPRMHLVSLVGLMVLVAGFSPGCISWHGQSSSSMKANLSKSYLFKSANRFYPDGVPGNVTNFPQLGPKQKQEIQQELAGLNNSLSTLHSRFHNELSNYFGGTLKSSFNSRIEVRNTGTPIAHSEPDGTIIIDVKVAQALFRGSVVDSYTHESVFSAARPLHESASVNTNGSIEQLALKALMKDVESIRKLKTHFLLGDMVAVLKEDTDAAWFDAADVAMRSQQIQLDYVGTAFFLLAHERGHLALGHFEKLEQAFGGKDWNDLPEPERQKYCQMRTDCENQADRYAALLLSTLQVQSQGAMIAFGPDMFGLSGLSGFEAFFNYSYDYGGFLDAVNAAVCDYPSVKERLAACSKINDTIVEEYRKRVSRKLEEELLKKTNKRR